MRPFVPLAFASQVRPGRGKRLLGQWREDMGAVCVDAAPVGFMGMADHAASAELLTASCYDKLEVACSASGGQHKWCIARGKCVRRLRAVAPDRKSVMHRTASASRTQCWSQPRRADALSWRCLVVHFKLDLHRRIADIL